MAAFYNLVTRYQTVIILDLMPARMMEVVSGDNWCYKVHEAPVKSSSTTNQHSTFYRLDDLPVANPTV